MKTLILAASVAGCFASYAAPASAQPICPAYLLRTELASVCTPVAALPFLRDNDRHDHRFRHRDHDHDHHDNDRARDRDHHHDNTRIRIRPSRDK